MPGRVDGLRRGEGVVSEAALGAAFLIASSELTSAISSTSSIVRTGLTVSFAVTWGGISDSSGSFVAGNPAMHAWLLQTVRRANMSKGNPE